MLPDHDLDDLLAGMVSLHQDLGSRVADLEMIGLPQNIHASAHLQLPRLRGYWPFSSVNESGNVYDLSAQGRVLTNHNNVPFAKYNLFPYADFTPGSNHYFSRADEPGLDITGAITFGGWFWLDTLASGNNQTLISKWDTTGGIDERAYMIYLDDATNTFRISISLLGTAATIKNVAHIATVAISTWYHVVGRLTPGTDESIFVDGVKVSSAVGVPATIFNSTANYEIGAGAAANRLDGRACQCFLCADDLDDVIIRRLYELTRANFGK